MNAGFHRFLVLGLRAMTREAVGRVRAGGAKNAATDLLLQARAIGQTKIIPFSALQRNRRENVPPGQGREQNLY